MARTLDVDLGPFKSLRPIGHDDAEAYDKQAGEIGACVTDADLSTWYRSTTNDAQAAILPLLEATGVVRPVNEKATEKAKARAKDPEKVEPVLMNFVPYANKVKAEVDAETWKAIDTKAHELVAAIAVDASPASRTKGPEKAALNKADDLLSDDETSRETRISRLLDAVDGFELDRDEAGVPDRTSLARLIQEFIKQSI